MVDRRFIVVLQSWAHWPNRGSADHIGHTGSLASLVTSTSASGLRRKARAFAWVVGFGRRGKGWSFRLQCETVH